jgi:hypothetical protein
MYPLDCDAGPMNGDNNITTTKGQGVIRICGTTRYYSTIYTRRRDIRGQGMRRILK